MMFIDAFFIVYLILSETIRKKVEKADAKIAKDLSDARIELNKSEKALNKVKAEFSDFTTVYAIVPFTFLPTEGLYGKIGYIEADIISIESGMTSSYLNASTEGYTVGLGYQKNTDNGIFIRLEASAATYENVSVTSSTASTADGTKNQVNIEDMMTARYQLSIGKSF